MPQPTAHIPDGLATRRDRPPVFSCQRQIQTPAPLLHETLIPNRRLKMDGVEFLGMIPSNAIPVAFLDPQHRGVLDKLAYGNEGEARVRRRTMLRQMPEELIRCFVEEIARTLIPSGHLFLWVDKFHLCQGVKSWYQATDLEIVDLMTWNKGTFGMGYRTRRRAEYCIVLQKKPKRAKGVWKIHTIPDVIEEKVSQRAHPHVKPVKLQGDLIEAVSGDGDFVIDPAAGSFSVMEAAMARGRTFLGCDLEG